MFHSPFVAFPTAGCAPSQHTQLSAAMSKVVAFTDGGCRGNPGVGAWAFVLVDAKTRQALERADGEQLTTNNRMEMTAAIQALQAVTNPKSSIHIVSDSKYLIDSCTKWMAGWKRN